MKQRRPSPPPSAKQTAQAPSRNSYPDWSIAVLLIVVTFIAYYPVWHGQPIWDDDRHLTRPGLRSWAGLFRIWFDLKATQQYYPLVHSTFWLEQKIWGESTTGYHLVNISLQALSALLLVRILRRLAIPGAWLAGFLFALHPVHVESVAWITELKNMLSGFLYLSALLIYLKFDESRRALAGNNTSTASSARQRKPVWKWCALAFLLFVLALLSKTVVASLPAALLVIFWWQRGKLRWRQDVMPLLPFFITGLTSGLFTAWVERTLIGATGAEFNFTFIERCLIAGRAIWFYLGKLLWPSPLIFMYPRWNVSQTVWWQYLFPLGVLAVVGLLWFHYRRTGKRGLLAGFFFFAGTLFPALGFFNVFPFRYSFVADHFQYLASLGIIVLLSALGTGWLQKTSTYQPAKKALCFGVVLTLAVLTWRQGPTYSSEEALWRDTIAKNPGCWMAWENLGQILQSLGKTDEALACYQQTLLLNPDQFKPHIDIGRIYAANGQLDKALQEYKLSLSIEPDATTHYDLALIYERQNRSPEAQAEYLEAIRLNPKLAMAHSKLASLLAADGKVEDAISHLTAAITYRPDYAIAWGKLGAILFQAGQPREATKCFETSLRLDPGSSEIHCSYGKLLLALGDRNGAIQHFREAVRLKPDSADAINSLSSAMAAGQ